MHWNGRSRALRRRWVPTDIASWLTWHCTRSLDICCAWFLTKPTIYAVQIKKLTTSPSRDRTPSCLIEGFLNFGAWSIPCNIGIGGSNEIWRYHRSELRPSQSNSKWSHEGKQENVCYVLCHIHLVNAVRHLSKCCASFLTEPTMYGAWSIPCHVDIGGSKWDV